MACGARGIPRNSLKNLSRALRLPFVTASILPFVFGSLLKQDNFLFLNFALGLAAVVATHLSANLINDYADSRSGVDWQDRKFYGFFGGSKLIQEKVLPEEFYLNAAIICFAVAGLSILVLSLILRSQLIIGLYLVILSLSWLYSLKPLQFSYCRWGEIIIFLLFGPVPVMGGYFIQSGIFPTWEGFLLSLPFGFLTTAILFANEVPDYPQDEKAGKLTWISFLGPGRSFLLYYLLIFLSFLFIVLNVALGYLRVPALLSLIFVFPALKAGRILKAYPQDKARLVESSRLTILTHTLAGVALILTKLL
jgi:1,4-dihydroxy-2-naphthoate octaprenyltransferase